VGCGRKRKDRAGPGFQGAEWQELRFDIDPAVEPDLVGTMTDMSAVRSESIDAVYSSHNIEHLYAHEVPVALREFLRVLRPEGYAVITCPDLQSVARLVADDRLTDPAYHSPAGPIAPLDILYGLRKAVAAGNLHMAHRCGFTRKVLMAALKQAGFAGVAGLTRSQKFDIWAIGTKQQVEDERLRELAHAISPIPQSAGPRHEAIAYSTAIRAAATRRSSLSSTL